MSNYAKLKDLEVKKEPADTYTGFSHLVNIANNKHKKELIDGHRVCVIDIWGEWCGPCKMIANPYAQLAEKYYKEGFCVLAKEDAGLELTPSVKGVPTFHFFKDGKFVDEIVGADIKGVEQKLVSLLSSL